MTAPGIRFVAALTVAAQLAATLVPLPAMACEPRATASLGTDATGDLAAVARLDFTTSPHAARPLRSPPGLLVRPHATFAGDANEEAAEDSTAAAAETVSSETPEPSPLSPVRLPALKRPRSAWPVWAGSAVLVGLFVAGVAHDLRNETAAEPEGDEPLPYFPNTP